MDITILGSEAHDSWFSQRLLAHGHTLLAADASAISAYRALLPPTGLWLGQTLLDTANSSTAERVKRAQLCHENGIAYAELAGQWLAFGIQYGFPLFVGSTEQTRCTISPILDALAPQPGAWLYCGPPGSGHFTAQIFGALSMACALAYKAGWSQPGQTPNAPDWGAFFQGQQQLASNLLQRALSYLGHYPQDPEQSTWQPLSEFNLPPGQQNHFAANLARLIVLSLGQTLPLKPQTEH